jgi:beta-glucosidase
MKATAVKFPADFAFGVATAAYQIEGAAAEDGRRRSIWDTFSHTPGKVLHGDTGDIACDHYHRIQEDLDLLVQLGVNAYRFSIAWPRVVPDGHGPVNRKGLDFYRRLVEELRLRDISPMATLYHWDLPQPLQDTGGWENRDTASRFAEYTAVVANELGDVVDRWITLNEPWCSAFVGHLEGRHAPGVANLTSALAASHHLLLGHGLSVQALRAASVSGEVGITVNLSDVHAAEDAGKPAASRIDGNENRWFLDPLFRGAYPADMVSWYADRADLSAIRTEDGVAIAQPLDFLGVNYYEQHQVVDDPGEPILNARKLAPTPPVTDAGNGVRPGGLANILRRLASDYTSLPLYITESGAAYFDYATPEGTVDDVERRDYLEQHFAAVHDCIATGVDVRGYYVWSFMDNFEWADGYRVRFGIVHVDYPSQRRTIKASGEWYRALVDSQAQSAALPS